MTQIRKSPHGIVVDHIEAGARYAISDKNYDSKVHRKVRELEAHETVLGYRPKRKGDLVVEDPEVPTGAEVSNQEGTE